MNDREHLDLTACDKPDQGEIAPALRDDFSLEAKRTK